MPSRDELLAWSWPGRPTSDSQFDEMMTSLDRHLTRLKLEPPQRAINAAIVVSSVLGLSGTDIFGGRKRGPPFSPSDLLARVHEWYSETYGDRMHIDWTLGPILIELHGNLWKAKTPMVFGAAQMFADRNLSNEGTRLAMTSKETARFNVLRSFEGMTQVYANKLTDTDMQVALRAYMLGMNGVACLDGLNGSHLFDEARANYNHSVDATIDGRAYGKARWESAECTEKIIKGLLDRDGHGYPTSGAKGHDHLHLGSLVREKLGIALDTTVFEAIKCTAAVRYGEVPSTREDALSAHYALLTMLRMLDAARVRFWKAPSSAVTVAPSAHSSTRGHDDSSL